MGITDGRPPKDLAPQLQGLTLAEVPVPTGREEEWRFTPLTRLRGLHDAAPATADANWSISASGATVEHAPVEAAGYLAADRISIAALTHAKQATIVSVPMETSVDEPIVLAMHAGRDTTYSHLRLVAGKYSKATFIVDVTGSGTHALTLELLVEEGANVNLVQVADGDRDQVLAGQHHIRIGRDANVQHIVVTLGGDVVRLVGSAQYDGPGGGIDALGVFFTEGVDDADDRAEQECDERVLADVVASRGDALADVLQLCSGPKRCISHLLCASTGLDRSGYVRGCRCWFDVPILEQILGVSLYLDALRPIEGRQLLALTGRRNRTRG